MDNEDLLLPVIFNGKELEFPARLLQYGYSIRLEVEVGEMKVTFEHDEERNWRALISPEDLSTHKSISPDLLAAISSSIEKLTSS